MEAMGTFAPVLLKVLGREYSFSPVLFAWHRLTHVCFTATCKLFSVCHFLPDLEYR